jgi:hypothetical protein
MKAIPADAAELAWVCAKSPDPIVIQAKQTEHATAVHIIVGRRPILSIWLAPRYDATVETTVYPRLTFKTCSESVIPVVRSIAGR